MKMPHNVLILIYYILEDTSLSLRVNVDVFMKYTTIPFNRLITGSPQGKCYPQNGALIMAKNIVRFLVILEIFFVAATGAANELTGDTNKGKQLASSCAACHGENGMSPNPAWPNLAGQNAVYILKNLEAFKSGERTDIMMSTAVKNLSQSDMQDIAAYYAQLQCEPVSTDAQIITPTETLQPLIDNCAACHGAKGISINSALPNLAGQNMQYLTNTLIAFRKNTRPSDIMFKIAKPLTDTQIEQLAAYYHNISCTQIAQKIY